MMLAPCVPLFTRPVTRLHPPLSLPDGYTSPSAHTPLGACESSGGGAAPSGLGFPGTAVACRHGNRRWPVSLPRSACVFRTAPLTKTRRGSFLHSLSGMLHGTGGRVGGLGHGLAQQPVRTGSQPFQSALTRRRPHSWDIFANGCTLSADFGALRLLSGPPGGSGAL